MNNDQLGRVSPETLSIARKAVQTAHRLADNHPNSVNDSWRIWIYEKVLTGIMMDWVKNGTEEIGEEEIDDIKSLVQVAISVASEQSVSLRDITFKTLLDAMINDWVQNWNMEEEE